MALWERPPGPLNVWKVVEGYERLKDGTKKTVKFSIQDIPNEEKRHKEVLDLMRNSFLADEPLCSSINIKDDPEGVKSFQDLWEYGLQQGVIIGCYKLNSEDKLEQLVGANVVFVTNKASKKFYEDFKNNIKSDNMKKVWGIYEMLCEKADVHKIYNVDTYISSISLSVLPEYRGQKLGFHMLNARSDLAKKYGIPATATMFTAEASQLQAKRAGFEEIISVDYENVVDEKGRPHFPNIKSKCAKIMMKRLP